MFLSILAGFSPIALKKKKVYKNRELSIYLIKRVVFWTEFIVRNPSGKNPSFTLLEMDIKPLTHCRVDVYYFKNKYLLILLNVPGDKD